MTISEESISVSFPSISMHSQGRNALEMQVVLCQIWQKWIWPMLATQTWSPGSAF